MCLIKQGSNFGKECNTLSEIPCLVFCERGMLKWQKVWTWYKCVISMLACTSLCFGWCVLLKKCHKSEKHLWFSSDGSMILCFLDFFRCNMYGTPVSIGWETQSTKRGQEGDRPITSLPPLLVCPSRMCKGLRILSSGASTFSTFKVTKGIFPWFLW
jgi:hypothetical protein